MAQQWLTVSHQKNRTTRKQQDWLSLSFSLTLARDSHILTEKGTASQGHVTQDYFRSSVHMNDADEYWSSPLVSEALRSVYRSLL